MTEQPGEMRDYAESIVDTVRKPLVLLDQDLRVKMANRAFYTTFGVTKEETEGAALYSLGDGQWDVPALRALLEGVLPRDSQFQDFEVSHEFPGIGRRVMLLNARRLRDADPRPGTILLAFEDATERLRAAEALRKSEERFKLVARATNDAIRDWDLLTGQVWWNEAFYDAFGYRAGEVSPGPESWTDRIHGDDAGRVSRGVRELLEGGGDGWADEYRFRRADGSYAVVFDRGYVVHDGQGSPVRLLGSMMDITERKQAEAKLAVYATRLERSNRELQDFASVASHDLQEPLRKIRAFGDRLAAKCGVSLGDGGGDYIRRMQSAAGRMQTLINDLLMFSRVDSKARPFVEVDLGVIAREVVADLEVQIEQAGAAVEVGRLPSVEADPLQMRQLLQNLIGNSLKYRRRDAKPVVKIYGEASEDGGPHGVGADGRRCRICVEDNGIGFDEKYLDRIFTVFQRLHGRTEYEGTGIGLAVCRKIVERHGGGITARSAPQKGSAFVVTLPVRQPREGAAS
ncbi:MAG TPA: ATP-binding protein [Pyrinomonadaceae bacterium]|jgi:PAS domain S-box-containing protein